MEKCKKEGGKKSEDMLTYYFLPSEQADYQKYKEFFDAYMNNANFNVDNKDLKNLLEKYGLDLFLLLILNKIISNLPLSQFESKDSYKNFCNYAKKIFLEDNSNLYDKDLIQLLSLFFDGNNYAKNIKAKLSKNGEKIDIQMFEALLYGFRFCVNSLNFEKNEIIDKENLLFPSLFSKDCVIKINSSLIPGIDFKEDLHLKYLDQIKSHFETYEDNNGCYVCSCGFYYNIFPCGFPTTNQTFNCLECGKKCGWGPKKVPGGAKNHGMVVRPGHYRIYKNQAQKDSQVSKWNDPDENIPNIFYDDYIKNVIEPIRKNSTFGFNPIEKDYFEKKDKEIRKLSMIGYRLLNFISYCHLFYSSCLGNINEEELNKCLIKDCDILKIIQIDWRLLKESLQTKDIDSIQIFLNMIFKDLSKLIKNYKITKIDLDRENFEIQVEELIIKSMEKYHDYSEKYKKENEKQSDSDINSLKTYVTELIHPSSDSYSEKEYPMFKYFNYTKYKSIEDMMKRMNDKKKYPLINQLVNESYDVEKLESLPAFNTFTNYMVDYYSFKLSREDAKKRVLDDEEITKQIGFNKMFGNFVKAWDLIKSDAIKYQCRPIMKVKQTFTKKDKLINFLNDAGELNNGMYLAAACENFITWQNRFLMPIKDTNMFNGILHNYINTILKKIPVQEAKSDQIILIKQRFEKSGNYADFIDLIYAFSERNVFGENGKINYSDYNTFVYDYDRIEEELGKILLPGVCQFEAEDQLNFVAYWGEGFRGGNTAMISKFYGKYPQIDLNNEEKQEVINYIVNMNKNKSKGNKYDFKNFFGSLQILLFYLTEKGIMDSKEKINNVINDAPEYLKLSDDFKNFFSNEGKNLVINNLMNLFFFFEHLCFEDLEETLQLEYKAKIPDDLKAKIIQKLLNQKNEKDTISTKDLAAAVRRYISRYLAGKRETTDFKEDRDLLSELGRIEFWEEKIGKNEDLIELITAKIFEFKLNIGQAYEFYNIIGEEDRNSIKVNK